MATQQWEYCTLSISPELHWDKQHKKEEWSYKLLVTYLGVERKYRQLAEVDKKTIIDFNPFPMVLGLLGAAGWELVSVQHGLTAAHSNIHGGIENYRNWHHEAFAYLKRPAETGRPVDEPPISI